MVKLSSEPGRLTIQYSSILNCTY